MKRPSSAGRAARLPFPSRGFPRRAGGSGWGLRKIALLAVLLFLSVGVACCGVADACADSDAFCFPSTLTGMCSDGEDGCRGYGSESRNDDASSPWSPSNALEAAFMLSDGGVVSCSIVNTVGGIRDRLSSAENDDASSSSTMCKAPLVPDMWMKASSGMNTDLGDHAQGVDSESGLVNGSLGRYVEISPPSLDWGEVSLYSPSRMHLTVRNLHSDQNLIIDKPFSTNSQYYAYDFKSVSLPPGSSFVISFVFLPRWPGSSSAHLVLQTSFGGFILQAKGMSTECPYRIEPLMDVDVPFNGRLSRNLSLYNPYDETLNVDEVSIWVSSVENANKYMHVVCSRDGAYQSSISPDAFLDDRKLFRVNNSDLGLPQVGFRPHKLWKLLPRTREPILEMNIWPHLEGKFFGAICLKIWNSTKERMDLIIYPLEIEVHGRTTYKGLVDSVSVYLETIGPLNRREGVFSIFLKNDGKELLRVVNVTEVTENPKLFKVKCMRGLILFPGTVTHIAVVGYTPYTTSEVVLPEVPSKQRDCMLIIMTNNSVDPVIKIPCEDIIQTYINSLDNPGFIASEGAHIKLISQQDEKISNARTGSLASFSETSNLPEGKFLEAIVEDDLIIKNWRSQGRTNEISVLEDRELLFPTVQVGSHFSKWISVRNPSQHPVIMQLLLNSLEIIDQCKSADDLYEHALSSGFTKTGSLETRIGFSVSNSAITEALVHPSESALFGPVVFHPSNRCTWRSSVLIRNNLSGVEWLPLQAFGGTHLLVLLEGSDPTWKLEFKFDVPINLNVSSSEQLSDSKRTRSLCTRRLSKEIYAKNIGELPLEVKKLKVSGTDCGLDGFMIHRCKGFALEPGESLRLLISYQADFSTAVVSRNLELAMGTGMFIIPMRASLPLSMLNICRKSFFHPVHWKVSLLIFAALSSLLLVLVRVFPHPLFLSSEEYYVTLDSKIRSVNKAGNPSRLCHITKSSRSVLVDEKPEVRYARDYPICQNSILESPEGIVGKQDTSNQKEITFSPPSLTAKDIPAAENSDPLIAPPQTSNLTIRVVKDKGRRKKRRASLAGIAAKVEVSSSQSGNSTPSSPLSPNTPPRQMWLLNAESADVPVGLAPAKKGHRKHNSQTSSEARATHAEKHRNETWSAPQQPPSVNQKPSADLTGLPSVNSPRSNSSPSFASSPSLSSLLSPVVAPYVRAPGPKSKAIKEEKIVEAPWEFTYDIWGVDFPDKLMGKPKEVTTKMPDASEGDSQSFFARDPKSLMMMPSARSVSPGRKLHSDAVTPLNDK